MAGEELEVVRLRNDFYRDGFYQVFIVLTMIVLSIILMLATSFYLYYTRPPPVYFYTDPDLRAFPNVPVSEPYVKPADLIQWVSEVLPSAFTFDFVNYDDQIKALRDYFTDRGWSVLMTLLTTYANSSLVQSSKLFLNASADGTPTIPNQGIIDGKYGWWVQMPLTLKRIGLDRHYESNIIAQVLVVRVPTLNNLTGIQIDNIIVQGGPPGAGQVPGAPTAAPSENTGVQQ